MVAFCLLHRAQLALEQLDVRALQLCGEQAPAPHVFVVVGEPCGCLVVRVIEVDRVITIISVTGKQGNIPKSVGLAGLSEGHVGKSFLTHPNDLTQITEIDP